MLSSSTLSVTPGQEQGPLAMQSLQSLHPPASCSLDTSWSCCSGSWISMAIREPSSITAFLSAGEPPLAPSDAGGLTPEQTSGCCRRCALLWDTALGFTYWLLCTVHTSSPTCVSPFPGLHGSSGTFTTCGLHPFRGPKELAWWSHPCPSVPKSMTYPSSKGTPAPCLLSH
ncbi:hypothetical protein mRhiFer1_009466 [Rhinolophus ferrumequinum]|uniref:Uncharacterized protein n=1 Tax=Rhinolophus ferrumequinum TaxID=59479 RepID=A0A7J7RIY5_RHIFE|nr:hypothetical protein mRhiFer1_009466 [Rhinolophus ferrumequinum]